MAGPWRVKFANPEPRGENETVAAYIARLGFVPWRRQASGGRLIAVAAMCPFCGAMGEVGLAPEARRLNGGATSVWTWNGSVDAPTLSPSVHYVDSRHPGPDTCGFHCWVRDGQIIDAGTPPHGGAS